MTGLSRPQPNPEQKGEASEDRGAARAARVPGQGAPTASLGHRPLFWESNRSSSQGNLPKFSVHCVVYTQKVCLVAQRGQTLILLGPVV